MAHAIFVSHSSKDKNIADSICAAIEARGIKCWIAPRNIKAGEEWPVAIVNAVTSSKAMVIIFSSKANHSKDVAKEALLAINTDIQIIPVKIDKSEPTGVMSYYLADREWLNITDQPFEETVNALLALLEKVDPQLDRASEGLLEASKTGSVEGPGQTETRLQKSLGKRRKAIIPAAVTSLLIIATLLTALLITGQNNLPQEEALFEAEDIAAQAASPAIPGEGGIQAEEPPETGSLGNSPGNLNNYGLIVSKDNLYYYRNPRDLFKIYVMDENWENLARLNDHGSSFLNIIGEWIYYINIDDFNAIYKIRTDGSGLTLISTDNAWHLTAVGDWLYYINKDDGETIYRIRTDGGERTRVNNNASAYINVVDDWIYFSNLNDNERIYRIRTDGSERTPVNNESSRSIVVDGGWIYYLSFKETAEQNYEDLFLCRIRTDGSSRSVIRNDKYPIREYNVGDNSIYYRNANSEIYRMNKEGQNIRFLTEHALLSINFIDNWVFTTSNLGDIYMKHQNSNTFRAIY